MDKFSKARAGGGGGVKSKCESSSKNCDAPKKIDQKSFRRLL